MISALNIQTIITEVSWYSDAVKLLHATNVYMNTTHTVHVAVSQSAKTLASCSTHYYAVHLPVCGGAN